MWAVIVDGVRVNEFRHYACACECAESQPGLNPDVEIRFIAELDTNAHELSIRLSAFKRLRYRMMRREKLNARHDM